MRPLFWVHLFTLFKIDIIIFLTLTMRKLLFTVLAVMLAVTVSAVPAKPGTKRVVKLADGSTVELTLRGDEHFSYYMDANERPCVLNNGQLEFLADGEVGNLWTARKQRHLSLTEASGHRSAKKRVGSPKVTKGKQRGLVILMEFPDVQFSSSNPQEVYNRFFNETGYTEGGNAGSVRDYFLAQSYGQLEIDFDVVGPYVTKQKMAYYGQPIKDDDGKVKEHDAHPVLMVAEAVDAASANVDFSNYDWDGDGQVDQVFVVYAGYAEAQGADETTIWPHEFTLAAEDEVRHYNGVSISTYGCSAELMGSKGTTMDGIGTACHEFSHCLGLPDMYDTQGNNYATSYWDVMCAGSYNMNSCIPAGYTSYERWFSGWMEPTELNSMTRINDMAPLAEKPEAYVLYNEKNKNEYYLLENRQPVGFDKGLYGHGLLILHVDYNKSAWETNAVNTVAERQRMTVIAADNSYGNRTARDIGGDTWPGLTGNTSLTNYTSPAATLYNANVDGQKLMSKPIDNITENTANNTVSFVACRPEMDVPDIDKTTVASSGNSFTIQWPAVDGAIAYEVELTSISKGASNPEDGLQREIDFSKCYSAKASFKDIGSSMASYGLSGWSGSKLYQSPKMLLMGTSSTAGTLKSPTWRVPESGNMTIVMGADVFTAGTPVKGSMTISYGNQGDAMSSVLTKTADFEVTGDGKLVLHFDDVRKDLFWLTINPEARMYVNYLAVYDGIWTEEQLGIGAASSRRATAVVETYATTTNSYTFQNMSRDNRYVYRVRALGEESTVSKWSNEGTFEFGTSGISPVSVSDANAPVRYYDLQGRKVDAGNRGVLIRRQGSDVRKVIVKD